MGNATLFLTYFFPIMILSQLQVLENLNIECAIGCPSEFQEILSNGTIIPPWENNSTAAII